MYEDQDWVEEMVSEMERKEKEPAKPAEKEPTRWTPEEIELAAQRTSYWCHQRQLEDRRKVTEREHRNRDPELVAAKQAMLRAVLSVINQ